MHRSQTEIARFLFNFPKFNSFLFFAVNPSEVPKTASAEPSVAKNTDVHIISIEKVRQQNDDEELELEDKRHHKIK